MNSMSMENLFKKAGLNYKSMELNTPYDVSNQNLCIKSFNHSTHKVEFNKILNLIRKDDSFICNLITDDGTILLKCTDNHRIFDEKSNSYIYIKDISDGFAYTETEQLIHFIIQKTNEISPILDMEVENTNNYFSNGILSHNTTPGGNAIKFFASIRCEVRKGDKTEGEDGEDTVGIIAKVKNIKNKTSVPFRKGELFFSFTDGIDIYGEYVDFGVSMGFIQKGGAWYTVEGERFQGRANTIEGLKNNQKIFETIKSKVDAQLAGNPLIDVQLPETIVDTSIESLAIQAGKQ